MNKSAQTVGRDQPQDPKDHQDRENRPKHATPLSASVPVLPLRGAATLSGRLICGAVAFSHKTTLIVWAVKYLSHKRHIRSEGPYGRITRGLRPYA